MNHESTVNSLGVGVQLLPVFWILLAVETTWLRTTFASPATGRLDRTFLRVSVIPLGAVAEILALVALLSDIDVIVQMAGYLLLFALVFSITNAGFALNAAIHRPRPDSAG